MKNFKELIDSDNHMELLTDYIRNGCEKKTGKEAIEYAKNDT